MDSLSGLPNGTVLRRRDKRSSRRRYICGDILLSTALLRVRDIDRSGDRRGKQILDSQRRDNDLHPLNNGTAFVLCRIASLFQLALSCGMRSYAVDSCSYTALKR